MYDRISNAIDGFTAVNCEHWVILNPCEPTVNPFANLRLRDVRQSANPNPPYIRCEPIRRRILRDCDPSRTRLSRTLANPREPSRTLANPRESVANPFVNPSANPPYILVYPRELIVNPRESAVNSSMAFVFSLLTVGVYVQRRPIGLKG